MPRYRSIVSHVFDGQLESTVECLTCHHLSRTTETFQVASASREMNPHLQDLSLSVLNREQLSRQASHVDVPPLGNSPRKKPPVRASLSL
jgi:ubiquitin C-terminal hydrolase